MYKQVLGCVLMVAAAGAFAPASAHHSFAMYDHNKTTTLEGTVQNFQWTNPHGYVELNVRDDKGAMAPFPLECPSINMMTRLGWSSHSIKQGDKITAEFAPSRSDPQTGLLMYVTFQNGKTMA